MADNLFENSHVEEIFESYHPKLKTQLLLIRGLIFYVAAKTPGVGKIQECLRWGEPSYITEETKSGSMIRVHSKSSDHKNMTYRIYFQCQTTLVTSFRKKYGDSLKYEGNRALVFSLHDKFPKKIVMECVREALTYKLRKSKV